MRRWPERMPDLLLLTFAAGSLDALSYLRGHAFTANMTGNTVLLGVSLLGHDRSRVAPCLVALAGFICGAVGAGWLLARGAASDNPRSDLRAGVALEMPALIAFAILWFAGRGRLLSIALLAAAGCALGIQSVAVRRMKIAGVATTFITGTITTAILDLVGKERVPGEAERPALPLVLMLIAYLGAAAAGALLYNVALPFACLAPLACAAIVVVRSVR